MSLRAKNVHFIGIGGTGMSGLAKVLLHDGYAVTGSDTDSNAVIQHLKDDGASISLGQRGDLITDTTELVVHSAAIKDDNPEMLKARSLDLPCMKYAEALGAIMSDRFSIAIAGTHGKTTISAMTSWILRAAGLDPSYVIGGNISQLGGNSHVGESKYFVVESCEYDRSFLNFTPQFALINNIEEDHLDYYSGIDEIVGAFEEFAARIPSDGKLFINLDCPTASMLPRRTASSVVTYGFHAGADYRGLNSEVYDGVYRFEVRHGDQSFGKFELSVPGWHNVVNALAAISIAAELGVEAEKLRDAIRAFRGVDRRFQLVAQINGITIVDDYAHHPTEVESVVQTALHRFRGQPLWVVFQPHQYSRTRFLLQDFAEKLQYCNHVLLPEIFFVRDSERDRQLVSAADLAREIRKRGGNGIFIPTLDMITDYLINNLDPGDVVITMGAGDVWKIADELVRRIQSIR